MEKLLSGGQTGADRGALDAAIATGVPYGGAIPRDRKTEAGPLPDSYRMEELDSPLYRVRTERNVKDGDETVGGLSGKIEIMAKNIATPYGAAVQYFDEALMANLWLQIPVIENTLALRIDAKGYFVAFREDVHAWENSSVFTPMARVIVNF